MKLLVDENLCDRIISQIVNIYPDSVHVKTLGLINTDDVLICEYFRIHDFVIASTWEHYFSEYFAELGSYAVGE
ncbi:hypothetical protein CDG79_12490 [Nostoc sp. 'Peltigera membranacea cyanobiont' 232]|nr:hypothetical protein CDG79_12490 [Nostoc sp. 'Peltigera membranacea cyanobiont' 232]